MDKKQEIADMKLEKNGMKLVKNTTFGLQQFAGNDDDIRFTLFFSIYSTLTSRYESSIFCHSIEIQGLR